MYCDSNTKLIHVLGFSSFSYFIEYIFAQLQAKAEYEATMKAISSEKNKTFERRQELQTIEDRVREDQRKLEREEDRWQAKQEEFEYTAATLKGKSEEVDEMFMVRIVVNTRKCYICGYFYV